MADRSRIEWTDATWNPMRARRGDGKEGWHCEHVSEACRNCYAERFNGRELVVGTGLAYVRQARESITPFVDQDTLLQPLRWRQPRRIFVCSMTDLFGEWHTDEMIDRVFATMAACPRHTFQVLTKRIGRAHAYLNTIDRATRVGRVFKDWPFGGWPLENVWLGVTAETQQTAHERIPLLLRAPATKRFASCEPLLSPIILPPGLDWVIAGGESGRGARPSHPDWFRLLRNQCEAAGTPFFFKQWGEWAPGEDEDAAFGEWHGEDGFMKSCMCSEGSGLVFRVGKARAGRLLDGREWSQFPGGGVL